MPKDIAESIINFYSKIAKDDNHRYKSWEHCYLHFNNKKDICADIKKSCLHLSFYLASWGMYRGSSVLLWKDYLIHEDVVEILSKNLDLRQLDFLSINKADLNGILYLISKIKKRYSEIITEVDGNPVTTAKGEPKKFIPSDTLVTKILLGTLGCIPAFDRFFIDGMRTSIKGIKNSNLTIANFKAVVEFYKSRLSEFVQAQEDIKRQSQVLYPVMKLVDMYFWEIGFQADRAEQERKKKEKAEKAAQSQKSKLDTANPEKMD